MIPGRVLGESLDEKGAGALRSIALAMSVSTVLLCGGVVLARSPRAPAPEDVRLANLLLMGAMAGAFALILASERLWRRALERAAPESAAGAVQSAYILRLACREGAAVLGALAAMNASQRGVLALYPAYWAALAPAGLFLTHVWLHWPSLARLRAELAELRPG